jgi:hypothetical protein
MHKSFIELSLVDGMSGQETVQAYCVKCRQKRDMLNPEVVTLKNGKPARKGKCTSCGTNMFRIGK